MFIPLKKCALYALPLVSAKPTYNTHPLTERASVRRDEATNTTGTTTGVTLPLTATSISDLLATGDNLIGQINAALGDILPTTIDSVSLLETTLDNIRQEVTEINDLSVTFAGLLQAATAAYVPTNAADILAAINNLENGGLTVENVAQAIIDGLSVADLTQNVLAGYLSGINSFNNVNPDPLDVIYPKKQSNDAPYDIPEAQLRAAIYIPPEFTFGIKRPILFVPGTGAYGGVNFVSNLAKLLAAEGFDPVYLNVPGAMLNDTQINSEYIAYATNYVGSITQDQNNLGLIAWSQGNLDTQWVFQYWPSTRQVVEDFISISGDFHGTTLAYFLDPAFPDVVPNPPSIIQQEYDSNFVLTLRNGGGYAPYVPSTSIHSITDEIVQPQYDPYASANYYATDLPGTPNTMLANSTCAARNVSYTNNQIQTICADQPAGGAYPHEGVLYNPLAYALALDALTHDGPGRIDRLDLTTICTQVVAPGLTPADVTATEGLIPLALVNILLYPSKVLDEPAVRQYALQANSANCGANSTNTTTTTMTTTTTASTTSSTTQTTSATTTTTTETSTSTSMLSTTSITTASSSSTATTNSISTSTTSASTTSTSTTSPSTLSSSTLSQSITSQSSASTGTTSTGTTSTGTTSTGTTSTGTTFTNTISSSTTPTSTTWTTITTSDTSMTTTGDSTSSTASSNPPRTSSTTFITTTSGVGSSTTTSGNTSIAASTATTGPVSTTSWSGSSSATGNSSPVPGSWTGWSTQSDAIVTVTTTNTHYFCPCETVA